MYIITFIIEQRSGTLKTSKLILYTLKAAVIIYCHTGGKWSNLKMQHWHIIILQSCYDENLHEQLPIYGTYLAGTNISIHLELCLLPPGECKANIHFPFSYGLVSINS